MGSDTQTITYSYQKNILAKSDHSAHITTGKLCPFSYLGRLIWPQLRCSWCGNAGWYLVYLMHRLGLTSCQAQNGLLFRCVCISRIYSVSHSLSHSLTKMKNQELYILSQFLILRLSVSQSLSLSLSVSVSLGHVVQGHIVSPPRLDHIGQYGTILDHTGPYGTIWSKQDHT